MRISQILKKMKMKMKKKKRKPRSHLKKGSLKHLKRLTVWCWVTLKWTVPLIIKRTKGVKKIKRRMRIKMIKLSPRGGSRRGSKNRLIQEEVGATLKETEVIEVEEERDNYDY
jgi:hypothetical protein